MSRFVVARFAETPPKQIQETYRRLGWKGNANARAIHEAAKHWMTIFGPPDGKEKPVSAAHEAISSLVFRFRDYLKEKHEPLACFTSSGVQVEGWLKGELLTFLTREMNQQLISDFDREVKCGDGFKKVDLTVSFAKQDRHWIELKHQLIGYQKGVFYASENYLKDRTNGILADVAKLAALNASNCYVVGTCNR